MSQECPTCGRDDFASERGLNQHHSRTHGESLRAVSLECEWCGDSYTKMPSVAEESRFCSNDCKFDYIHEQNRGSGERVVVPCDNCGADIERHPNEVRDNVFCNQKCHGEWLSGENHHNWKGGDVEVECCVCGDTKEVPPNRAEKFDRHFCYEKGCRYEWISENHSGEDNPRWKGGVSHGYPGGWKSTRQEIRKRDNYQCRACGTTQEEHLEEVGCKLDVHHVVPVREFDDPADAHSKGNLVTACRSCHMKYEGLPVFPN